MIKLKKYIEERISSLEQLKHQHRESIKREERKLEDLDLKIDELNFTLNEIKTLEKE